MRIGKAPPDFPYFQKTSLANFSILGDVELVNTLADQLAEKLKALPFDYLVALEVKGGESRAAGARHGFAFGA